VLRGDRQNSSTITTNTTTTTTSTTATIATSNPTPAYESPPTSATVNTVEKTTNKYNAKINNNIGVKVNRESNNSSSSNNNNTNNKYVSATAKRTLSEPSLLIATSDSGRSGRSSREKHRHRRTRTPRHKTEKQRRHSRFGYEIQDVDAFLTKVRISLKIWNKVKVCVDV